MRKTLEDAAGSKRSLSEEIHARLKASVYEKKEEDPFLHGLYFLFSQAAVMDPKSGSLVDDRYKFEVFRSAVLGLLDRLAPQGDVEPPDVTAIMPEITSQPDLANIFKSPQAAGAMHATAVWSLLRASEEETADLPETLRSWAYTYPRARRDLKIDVDPSIRVSARRQIERIKAGEAS